MGWSFDPAGLMRKSMSYLLPAVAAMLIGMVYYLGIYSERTGFVEQVLDPSLKRITHPVLNAFRGRPPHVPEVRITLDGPELDSLHKWRDRALEEGWLAPGSDQRLPTELVWEERILSAQISLHPGAANDVQGDQWPMVLHLGGTDSILGMQSFVLRAVTDASPLYGWILQQALREQGHPTFNAGLSELILNDRAMGLYTLEALPDPMQLAQWDRGTGPLLRFDDALRLGAASIQGLFRYPTAPPLQADWLSAPVVAMRTPPERQGHDFGARFTVYARSLDGFRSGQLAPSEVFDVDALARLLALCDILGAQGTISWWNLRFLADSTSGRLVVVPLRTIAGPPISTPLALRTDAPVRFPSASSDLLGRFFGDQRLFTTYIAYLDTFSTSGWLEELLGRLATPFAMQHRIIRSELPNMEYNSDILFHDRSVIQAMLRPRNLVLAYTQGMQNKKRPIAVANVHSLPVWVVGAVAGGDTIRPIQPALLWPRERDKPLVYRNVEFDMSGTEAPLAELLVQLIGVDEILHAKIRTWGMFAAN